METIWPLLLILTTFAGVFFKLVNYGQPIEVSTLKAVNGMGSTLTATVLNVALLYLCGFFTVWAWPQILWLCLTGLGLVIVLFAVIGFMLIPRFAERVKEYTDERMMVIKPSFVDLFTIVMTLIIYVCGGAFAAW